MKINLTKKQYWNFVRATYMADWMANAICDGDMKQDDGIKEIRNYIFSFGKEMGLEKYMGYDEELGSYYATLEMDDEPSVRSLIKRYDEDVAWDEIIERLGERDFRRKYSIEEIKKMTDEERFTKRMECEEVWGREFEENGIERLEILKTAEDFGL
ncbi:MAG: hypothetical protein NUV54_01270 [Candidatus Taylorbacteria bacterium]|nr:hypothetical protein [Candidatus Taylorbacteria bacterium]